MEGEGEIGIKSSEREKLGGEFWVDLEILRTP